jgi:hypothetical protein
MKVLRPCVVWYSSTKKGRVKVLLDIMSGQGMFSSTARLLHPPFGGWHHAPIS